MPEAYTEAQAAIHHIGANGIPFLLSLVRAKEAPSELRLRAIVPRSWHGLLGLHDKTYHFSKIRATGVSGLCILSTNVGPAIPALMELVSLEMNRPPSDVAASAWPLMLFGILGKEADPAVPLMIQCLTNHDRHLRDAAVESLGQLQRRPEVVVPALLACLNAHRDTDDWEDYRTSYRAIKSIGRFGTNASSAAPALVGFLTNQNPYTRQVATNALIAVDPASAERAGIRIERRR